MAFWDAVEAGSVAGMRAAVLAGASINHYNAGIATGLHKAAECGDSTMVSALLESGAAINLKTRIANETALILAAGRGRVDVVKVLVNAGADMSIKNAKGETAYTIATQRNHADVLQLLASGTEPQVLPHKRIADSIRTTSAASPSRRLAYGTLTVDTRAASRSSLGRSSAPHWGTSYRYACLVHTPLHLKVHLHSLLLLSMSGDRLTIFISR